MVTIAALLKRYGLVMSLPSIFLSDDRGFKVFFKMFFKKKNKKKKKTNVLVIIRVRSVLMIQC